MSGDYLRCRINRFCRSDAIKKRFIGQIYSKKIRSIRIKKLYFASQCEKDEKSLISAIRSYIYMIVQATGIVILTNYTLELLRLN